MVAIKDKHEYKKVGLDHTSIGDQETGIDCAMKLIHAPHYSDLIDT